MQDVNIMRSKDPSYKARLETGADNLASQMEVVLSPLDKLLGGHGHFSYARKIAVVALELNAKLQASSGHIQYIWPPVGELFDNDRHELASSENLGSYNKNAQKILLSVMFGVMHTKLNGDVMVYSRPKVTLQKPYV